MRLALLRDESGFGVERFMSWMRGQRGIMTMMAIYLLLPHSSDTLEEEEKGELWDEMRQSSTPLCLHGHTTCTLRVPGVDQ